MGTERAARPASTRSGCETDTRTDPPFVRRLVAWSANALVVRDDIRVIIPPRRRGIAVPSSASAESRHVPTANPVSTPANAASAESEPNAPAAAVPSSVPRSFSQPARKPTGASKGRHDSAAPDVGARPAAPDVVNAVAAIPLAPVKVNVVACRASTK